MRRLIHRGTTKGTTKRRLGAALAVSYVVFACVAQPTEIPLHGWWHGLGPVVPHDTFPTDCSLCHVGQDWNNLLPDFEYDHETETGVPLNGAHAQAQCLRCHNDRGPVEAFQVQGCAGCHEDIHLGTLDPNCVSCHQENTWRPTHGAVELHNQTRFPLVGVHATTSCRHCHQGAEVGIFLPADPDCLTCHADDLARANNPPHAALGLVDDCQRCHMPTNWNQAVLN